MRKTSLAAAAAVILLATWFVYGRLFDIAPFSGDNIRILFWAAHAPASAVMQADPAVYPEWRPIAYLTVWLQYDWLQLDHLQIFYGINLLIWIGCALLIFASVRRLTSAVVPAAIAAVLVFSDWRAVGPLSVMERANLLACMFGLAALFLTLDSPSSRPTRTRAACIAFLLLASGLSKEYGLAFTCAVAAAGILERRRDLAVAAVAAATTYGLLRLMFAHGAFATYCEDVGYFSEMRSVCFANAGSIATPEAIYNMGATALGTLVPSLFTTWGQLFVDPLGAAMQAVWVVIALLGWRKGPRALRATLVLVIANAALSFMLYRIRNHMVGLCGLGIAVGTGINAADEWLRTWNERRDVRLFAVAAMIALLAFRAAGTRAIVSAEAADSYLVDPCDALDEGRPLDPAFVRRIKTAYSLPDPGCTASR
jgi:hypothetical protein